MIGMRTHAVICAIAILALAGCEKSSPTDPSGTLAGNWSGPIAGTAAGDATAQIALTQTGAGVTGTYTLAYTDASKNQSGVAGGTLAGTTLALTLTPAQPLVCGSATLSGTMSATLTMSAPDRLEGSYAAFVCGGAIGGSIALQRRP
ncbi:MAG TPA: hypothetical protein VG736_10025 [Vicinamibacterales bacterium]|jgi:hypothetical protein|nr:hypothetical protein [Vicinamibacterales bacterium]